MRLIFFQAEGGIHFFSLSRGLGDVCRGQEEMDVTSFAHVCSISRKYQVIVGFDRSSSTKGRCHGRVSLVAVTFERRLDDSESAPGLAGSFQRFVCLHTNDSV